MNRNQRESEQREVTRIHKGADTRDLDRVIDHTLRPVKRLSYFEREQALALGKTLDQNGNIDLSESANQTSYQGTGRQNRNALVNAVSAEKAERVHPSEFSEGDLGRHGRFCKDAFGRDIQGRNCNVCHGVGYTAYLELRKAKEAGNSPNQSRFQMPEDTNGPNGSTAPPNTDFNH